MKPISLLQKRRWVIVSVIVLGMVALWAVRQSSVRLNDVNRQQLLNRLAQGLGSEIQLPAPTASIEQVAASVDRTAGFIHNRSNLTFAETTKKRIADLEHHALTGVNRHLTVADLTEILLQTALDRAALLTDDEIKHAVETARGFNAPDLPEGFRQGRNSTKLRAHSTGPSPETLTQELIGLRNPANRATNETLTRPIIERVMKERLALFSEAVPAQWSGTWNVATNSEGSVGLSPHQAIILAYSITSDDYLTDSITSLRTRMDSVAQALTVRTGHYPNAQGYFAYGVNGYFHSTPIDLMFDVATTGRLLDKIEERSRR